jgi:hypothetical protein
VARDLRAGRLVDRRTVGTLAPLLDPELPGGAVRALTNELASPHFRSGIGVASYDLLVADAGMREYFDPCTCEGRGSADFSWTAASPSTCCARGPVV